MGISLLQELLERGFLEIEDSDDRFEKLQRAVQDLTNRFAQAPSHIVCSLPEVGSSAPENRARSRAGSPLQIEYESERVANIPG
jgi:hypothetical protein